MPQLNWHFKHDLHKNLIQILDFFLHKQMIRGTKNHILRKFAISAKLPKVYLIYSNWFRKQREREIEKQVSVFDENHQLNHGVKILTILKTKVI